MIPNRTRTGNSTFWILHISGWLILSIFDFLLYYKEPFNQTGLILRFFSRYIAGLYVSLFLRYFYKEIRYQSRSILSLLIIIVAASGIMAHIWFGIEIGIDIFRIGRENVFDEFFTLYYFHYILLNSVVFLTWSVLYFGIKLWRDWGLQKDKTENANVLAKDAQLQMLRYQLNPHFLFNSLNSILTLLDKDEENAIMMVTQLTEFLNYSLVKKNYSNVPLNDELEAIRNYFAIQKRRYEKNLEVVFDIAPEAENYPVLSFLIHPLVENAVKYGMQTSTMPLKIRIRAEIENGSLKLEVANTGKWIKRTARKEDDIYGTGTGLENVQKRLENAFPDSHRLDIVEEDGIVNIRLEINKKLSMENEKTI